MPEANQYLFSNRELLELLIKQADVHDGRWALMLNFTIGTGLSLQSPDLLAPGMSMIVSQVGIQKAQLGLPDEASVDAATVNPRASKKK